MECDHVKVRLVVEEDRLSSLPDELIHKILSSFDMKFVIRMCVLSSRWKLLWTSMPCLNFSSWQFRTLRTFRTLPKFPKFVTKVLSHRNHQIEVFSVKIDFNEAAEDNVFVREIADYAFSHNVQYLTVQSWEIAPHPFSPCLFSSKSLKSFTIANVFFSFKPYVTPKTPWDFPALTTFHLSHITLSDDDTEKSVDLFSKCVNLQNLTIEWFTVKAAEFDIITPRLSNLTLIEGDYVKVINLIAPQLENFTITGSPIGYLNAPSGVSSFCYRCHYPRQLTKDGIHNLNKVSICLSMCNRNEAYDPNKAYKKEDARKTINMLQEFRSARYLTLNLNIIECLSSFPNLLSHHPSPFSNLICLNIDSSMRKDACKVKLSTEVRNFFLENSPNATLIGESPEEPPTRAMKQKEARAKKKAKLAAEIESHMKELQALIEQGNMIVEQKGKVKAAFENIITILSKKIQIKSLLEKLPMRERAEIEARYSPQIEKLISDYNLTLEPPSSSSPPIPTPSTSSINPLP